MADEDDSLISSEYPSYYEATEDTDPSEHEKQVLFEGMSGDVCVMRNMSDGKRLRRGIIGALLLAGTIAIAAVLCLWNIHRLWRLAVAPLWFGSGLTIFQWYQRTCVYLAWKGQVEKDGSTANIAVAAQRAADRKRAILIFVYSFLFAVLCTAAHMLVPVNLLNK
eukprot:TRINITY_DN7643_c0_g1_i1.p1 TRINITY_DN7643_c0_g1~~TRINITY_DN7643_c0_g1_i1.p1  ORF type:complete len:165 (+),score=28.20 TRINITY_DN7643_c0_g1_i1:165-659(+)